MTPEYSLAEQTARGNSDPLSATLTAVSWPGDRIDPISEYIIVAHDFKVLAAAANVIVAPHEDCSGNALVLPTCQAQFQGEFAVASQYLPNLGLQHSVTYTLAGGGNVGNRQSPWENMLVANAPVNILITSGRILHLAEVCHSCLGVTTQPIFSNPKAKFDLVKTLDEVAVGLQDELFRIQRLDERWDGENAARFSSATIETAGQLLIAIIPFLICVSRESSPFFVPFPDGTLQVKWLNKDKELSISMLDRVLEVQRWDSRNSYDSQGYWEISISEIADHLAWIAR